MQFKISLQWACKQVSKWLTQRSFSYLMVMGMGRSSQYCWCLLLKLFLVQLSLQPIGPSWTGVATHLPHTTRAAPCPNWLTQVWNPPQRGQTLRYNPELTVGSVWTHIFSYHILLPLPSLCSEHSLNKSWAPKSLSQALPLGKLP